MKVKSLSRVRLLATPWTAAYQAPPSTGFSRQEYWSGVPLPSPPASSTDAQSPPHHTQGLAPSRRLICAHFLPLPKPNPSLPQTSSLAIMQNRPGGPGRRQGDEKDSHGLCLQGTCRGLRLSWNPSSPTPPPGPHLSDEHHHGQPPRPARPPQILPFPHPTCAAGQYV